MIFLPIFRKFAYTLLVVTFAGCIKKELPVAPHQSGNVTKATVNIDASYKYQAYFSLKNNTVIGQNEKTDWDIALETSPAGYHIVLNGAKSMFAFYTGKADFGSVSAADTTGLSANKKCDSYTGNLDSTAVGDWRVAQSVFVIDRGFNELGQHQGFSKVQFLTADKNSYTLRLAALSGAGDITRSVTKDTLYNLSFVSFTSGQQVMVEPPKADWDIMFTQYTYMFYDVTPPTPYLVTGCLLNRNNTQAYLDTTHHFSEINYSTIQPEKLSSDISAIGYNWKSFNGTKYTIVPHYNYIIRGAGGIYYKLHFTGFYNTSGIKGHPQWEYQRL